MKSLRLGSTLLLAASLTFALPVSAAVDAFIWFDEIRGASSDPRHNGWIEVESHQLVQFRNTTIGSATGGAGAGKIKFNEFTIKKTSDRATPKLLEAAAKGKVFREVVIEMHKAGGGSQEYLVIKLENVQITSYQVGASGAGGPETMKLSFTNMTLKNPPAPPSPPARSNVPLAPGAASATKR